MENDGGEEETPRPQNLYTIFLVILAFFVTGLMGILLCHILQEKGYRCRTFRELQPEAGSAAAAQGGQDPNQDTVGQIVQCILDNKANAEALKEMLKEHEQMKPPAHRFRVTRIERCRAGEELSTFPVEEVCVQAHTEETERDPEGGSRELQGLGASPGGRPPLPHTD
ncbi:RELT-like protein 2 [Pristis pectinata]|uniref:RELT-like protein 2 n=1 Tax=Pristis pectinata TaxID=685728 RepID=UPI00223D20C0|nr:RELT-like protein 2 [Pristis pectinata]